MEKILILGASGYAGQAIKQMLGAEFKYVFGTYHRKQGTVTSKDNTMFHYNLETPELLEMLLAKVKPTVIIYCLRGDFLLQINAVRTITNYIKKEKKGKIVFLSSANVFDGAPEVPHYEGDMPKSDSEYGKFKIQCENIILDDLGDRGIIIRIPEIYGIMCPRLLKLMDASQNHQVINTYKNIYVNYTTDKFMARWILYILNHDLSGIFHIGSKDASDYYAFQVRLMKALNLELPPFNIEEETLMQYQAVLPSRKEIPDSLQYYVSDVIEEMVTSTTANN